MRTPDGKVYKLDDEGNRQALAALKEDRKLTNITVVGSFNGETVQVQSIELH